MKLRLYTFKLPRYHTWYLNLTVTRKHKKTGEMIDVLYSFSTPFPSKEYWTILPAIETRCRPKTVNDAGPQFEIRLAWLKYSMKIFSREAMWSDNG